ncbi:MAG: sel1 repeat family protein [Epsilonproteobacteria bacterium]|nr:sel1 repeat family protein [Campylobacterota bacterium]
MKKMILFFLFGATLLFATESVKDLEEACAKENAEACLKVGAIYYDGDGVERDRKKGIKYLRAACICGSEVACEVVEKVD